MTYPEIIDTMWVRLALLQETLGKVPLLETVEGIKWLIDMKKLVDTEYLPTLDEDTLRVVEADLHLMSKGVWRVFNHCEMITNFAGINVRQVYVFGRAS